MPTKSRSKRKVVLMNVGAALLLCYLSGYFFASELFHGMFQGERVKLRIFSHYWQLQLWAPLVQIEKWSRRDEFHGHVSNGASTPPADPAFYPELESNASKAFGETNSTSPFLLYTVRRGDSLQTIASQYGVSLSKLMALNGLRTEQIRVGQELRVPTNSNR